MSHQYPFSCTHHQRALVIGNGSFDAATGLPQRRGYQRDVDELRETFQSLGFTVDVHTDVNRAALLSALQEMASEDHSGTDCLVVVISTHGGQREVPSPDEKEKGMEEFKFFQSVDILYAIDEPLEVGEILRIFNEESCPSLAGKPKLFFIQSSRGNQLCEEVTIKSDGATGKSEAISLSPEICVEDGKPKMPPPEMNAPSGTGEKIVCRKTDIRRDFLVMWSAPPGYVSFHRAGGSPFILTLCDVLRKQHHEFDLMTMLTEVTRRVATEFTSRTPDPETNGRHMMPSIEHMLRKSVHFTAQE